MWNSGAIISLAPDLSVFTKLLRVDEATVRKVLASWGPGKFDAQLNLDGKAFRPDGAGKSFVVLDDGPIGGGMTGKTTAHLVTALDDRYFELEKLHGEKGARLAAESHAASIDQVERIVGGKDRVRVRAT